MITYTLKVADIKKETEDSLTLCFKQPGLRKIKYKAGQFLTLIFRINDRRFIRPYSFSSSPSVDSLLEVTIKRVPGGVVSNHIHDQVQIGDIIEVFAPMGDFIFEDDENISEIYFWGAGSGITPLISLIKEILFSNPVITLNLVYGNRSHAAAIFLDKINDLRNLYPERLKVWYFYTELHIKERSPFLIEGRINSDFALGILDSKYLKNTRHYICGPVGLKESIKESLASLGTPDINIISEDFEIVRNERDFKDIVTQYITLKFQNVEHTLEVTRGRSILESALDAGIELPYSCQIGNCSTCKATLVGGDVKMIGLTKERADLEDNEYLLCCSHPLSQKVMLEL